MEIAPRSERGNGRALDNGYFPGLAPHGRHDGLAVMAGVTDGGGANQTGEAAPLAAIARGQGKNNKVR
jgi:hypothetical protein